MSSILEQLLESEWGKTVSINENHDPFSKARWYESSDSSLNEIIPAKTMISLLTEMTLIGKVNVHLFTSVMNMAKIDEIDEAHITKMLNGVIKRMPHLAKRRYKHDGSWLSSMSEDFNGTKDTGYDDDNNISKLNSLFKAWYKIESAIDKAEVPYQKWMDSLDDEGKTWEKASLLFSHPVYLGDDFVAEELTYLEDYLPKGIEFEG